MNRPDLDRPARRPEKKRRAGAAAGKEPAGAVETRGLVGVRVVWIAGALFLLAPPTARADLGSCVACHSPVAQQFTSSVHARAGVACADCHGGDAAVNDKSAHSTVDFRRPHSKQEIAEGCASCHSDVRKMNAYGLPTDQLERYKTSKHGEQLFGQGDEKVAVCTDCHGVHDIETAQSPQSRTYPTHIPDTCARCHADETLMSQYGLPSNVVEEYKVGYHAQMLFEKGDLSAPTCITCHGNHGATPPSVAEVGQVCGKCHGRQRELFEKSPHFAAAEAGAFNECVACHGNHAIRKASPELFAEACIQCHSDGDRALVVRDSLVLLIQNAGNISKEAAGKVEQARVKGLDVEDHEVLVQEANTSATQMEALQHSLDPELLKSASTHAEESAESALKGINDLERLEHWKRLALTPIWGFLIVMAALFWRKHEQVLKEDGK